MLKTIKVAFGIPTEGHTPPESFQSLRLMCHRHGVLSAQSKAEGRDEQFEFYDMTAGRMFTPMAREKLADQALAAGMDYLFMVDDDMLCPYNLFERLYSRKVDIIAPLAFTRNPPHLAVLYKITEGWDPIKRQQYCISEWIKNWPRNTVVECDAVGFGAVLIDMRVIRKLERPFFMCSSGTGEDVWFCHRAKKEAGARVFMDTTFEIGHIGAPIIIGTAEHDRLNDPKEAERIYGQYKKWGVYNVSHFDDAKSDEPEVLAL